jgi:hypothetical protein
MEAMLAARITAAQFHVLDSLRSAALSDLPSSLQVRYRASATGLTRMQTAAQRELIKLQALPARQPAALPVAEPAPRPQPAPAVAPSAPAQPAAPVARPNAGAGQRQAAAAAQPPSSNIFDADKREALIEQMMAMEDKLLAVAAQARAA